MVQGAEASTVTVPKNQRRRGEKGFGPTGVPGRKEETADS